MVEKTDQLWKGPPNLTMVFLLINFKICTENGQIKTTKTGVNKDLVLGDNYQARAKRGRPQGGRADRGLLTN